MHIRFMMQVKTGKSESYSSCHKGQKKPFKVKGDSTGGMKKKRRVVRNSPK